MNILSTIIEKILVKLASKLSPIIYENIRQRIFEDIYNNEIVRFEFNKIQDKLRDITEKFDYLEYTTISNLDNRIDKINEETKEQLSNIGSAIKSVYDLVSSVIHINTQH